MPWARSFAFAFPACGDVSHESLVFGAFHGRLAEQGAVGAFRQLCPIARRHAEEGF